MQARQPLTKSEGVALFTHNSSSLPSTSMAQTTTAEKYPITKQHFHNRRQKRKVKHRAGLCVCVCVCVCVFFFGNHPAKQQEERAAAMVLSEEDSQAARLSKLTESIKALCNATAEDGKQHERAGPTPIQLAEEIEGLIGQHKKTCCQFQGTWMPCVLLCVRVCPGLHYPGYSLIFVPPSSPKITHVVLTPLKTKQASCRSFKSSHSSSTLFWVCACFVPLLLSLHVCVCVC